MTYAGAVGHYYAAGWRCILPVPVRSKHPPPDGYTGEHGIDTVDPVQLAQWATTHGSCSIALRLPAGVIGLDIDQYDKTSTLPDGTTKTVSKRGAATIAEFEEKWGPLPSTWASTARPGEFEGGASRTLFYRVPPGRYASALGDAVEVLQRHHRYCMVWPSTNPDASGAGCHWYAPGPENARVPSVAAWRVPGPDEFTELPARWVAGLAGGASAATPLAARGDLAVCLLTAVLADDRPACAEIDNARLTALHELATGAAGSRHDTATGRVYHVIRLAAFGHPGAGTALHELADRWAELTAGEDREREFELMCLSAAAKAVTEIGGAVPVPRDPCAMISHWGPPTPVRLTTDEAPDPGPDPGSDPAWMAPDVPVAWSRRELIGTHLFDPSVGLDQLLADAVLERVHPVLRYAADAGAWVLRNPHAWELCPDMADWAVTEMFPLMPRGDPDAEKNTTERNRAERRKRFGTQGNSSSIAGKMRAIVRATGHPCTVALSELDSDPEILWAGGLPWSLRHSLGSPVLASVDPATPHLESAGVPPSGHGIEHPTPHWDTYTAAIWPDPEIREYALQVLAVSLTGYSDAVLPILLGPTGSGKTSLIALLMSILGSYACAADPRLLSSIDNTHASIVFVLKGKRLASIDEGPREGKLATGRLKQLTGGGDLTGNSMRNNPVTFRPTHTLMLTCNPEETPTFGDPALRRRVRLLPCEADPVAVATTRAAISPAVWHTEAPGVLAAMMHRAARWLADRAVASREAAPGSIRYRAEEIAAEQDLVRGWIDAEMEPHESGMRTADLLARYADWTRRFRLSPPSLTQFGRKLTELGYPAVRREDGNYRALRVRPGSVTGPYVPPPTGTAAAPADGGQCPKAPQIEDEKTRVGVVNTELLTHTSDGTHTTSTPGSVGTAISEDRGSSGDPMSESSGTIPESPPLVDQENGLDGLDGSGRSKSNRPGNDHDPDLVFSSSPGRLDSFLCFPFQPSNTTTIIDILDIQDPQKTTTAGNAKKPSNRPGSDHRVPPDQAIHVLDGLAVPSRQPSRCPGDPLQPSPVREPADAEALRAVLAAQRAQRNDLTKRIRQAAKHEPAAVVGLELERDHVKETIRKIERGLREATAALKRVAAVAEVAGVLLELPAVKVRGAEPVAVDLATAMRVVREAVARDAGRCTVAIETTGFPIGHPDHAVRTVQLGDRDTAAVFAPDDPAQFATAVLLLGEAPELQAYSAAVELSNLAHIGMLDFARDWDRVHDVVIAAQLANPIGTLSSEAGLKHQSELRMPDTAVSPAAEQRRAELFRRGGWLTDTKIKGGGWQPIGRSGWAQVDSRCAAMVDYAASDVLDTAALRHALPAVPPAVYARERAVQAAVAGVSYHGLRLDGPHIETMIERTEPERDAALVALRQLGIDNPASNDQVAEALTARGAQLARTETGKSSVKAHVLANLPRTPELAPLIDQIDSYRHHNRLLTTYLGPYDVLVRYGDGRMRPIIYTLQADTGRMSAVHPNLQNIPRIGGIRECITADEDDLFVDADLSGVEVAVLAALSQDPGLLEIVHGPKKLHAIIAEIVFGPEYTTEEYTYVKNGVFAKFYGAGIDRIASTVGCSLQVAQSMTDVLDEVAPVAKQWGYQWRNAVKNGTTSYELYSGRVLHLPQQYPHKVMNYLIQATAREIFVDGLLQWAQTRWGRYKVTVPVHDEILASVPGGEADEAQSVLSACMSTELYGVRIGADPKWKQPSWRWKSNDAA